MMSVATLFRIVTKEGVESITKMTSTNKKEYSNHLHELVIKHLLNGDSEREITKKVLISRDPVHYIIAKYKSTKSIGNLMYRGLRRKASTHTDHIPQRKIKTNRRKSAASIKTELENELKVIISESTVRRRLHEVDLYGRVARKKTLLE